jgi:hypothetical protein
MGIHLDCGTSYEILMGVLFQFIEMTDLDVIWAPRLNWVILLCCDLFFRYKECHNLGLHFKLLQILNIVTL